MKQWIHNHKVYLIGAVLGTVAGFLYWQQIGCASGTCMITSKPLNSSLYGAFMGMLVGGMFIKEKPRKE